MKRAVLALGVGLAFTTISLGAPDDLAPYPATSAGQVQHVIKLPALEDEMEAKVQIIVGKTMSVDCNQHFFTGQLEQKTAEGWGYTYLVLESLGSQASTLMGCLESSEREAFVRSSGETLVPYNSALPVVIYTPEDVEVMYRVWTAGPVESVASQ